MTTTTIDSPGAPPRAPQPLNADRPSGLSPLVGRLSLALTLLAVAAMALLCLMRGEALFIDVAVLLALVSFLGTAAFAFLFDDAHSQMPEKSEERP